MGAHTTSDDPTKYQVFSDVELWRDRDPIERLKVYLRAKGVLNNELESEISDEAAALTERMRKGCRELPDPNPLSMFNHVYSESDLNIDEQRREVETILSRSQNN